MIAETIALKFPFVVPLAVTMLAAVNEALVIAQAAPAPASGGSGLDRLTELGAIGAVLAFILWQQSQRDRATREEVAAREARMVERLSVLEDRDSSTIRELREDNDQLRNYIQAQLMRVVEMQTANVQTCHSWRDEAREQLHKLTGPEEPKQHD